MSGLTHLSLQVELRFRDGRVLSTNASVLQLASPVLSDLCNVLREPYVLHLDNDEHDAWKLLLELLYGNFALRLSLKRARLLLPLIDKYDITERLLEAQQFLSSDCFIQGNPNIEELRGWIELLGRPSCLDTRAALKACTDQLQQHLTTALTSCKAAGLTVLAVLAAFTCLSAAIAAMATIKSNWEDALTTAEVASSAAAAAADSARDKIVNCHSSMGYWCRVFAWIHDCCWRDRYSFQAAEKAAAKALADLAFVTDEAWFFEMASNVVIVGLRFLELAIIALVAINAPSAIEALSIACIAGVCLASQKHLQQQRLRLLEINSPDNMV